MNILAVTCSMPNALATNGGQIVMFGEMRTIARRHRLTLVSFSWVPGDDTAAVRRLEELGIVVHVLPTRRRTRAHLFPQWLAGGLPMGVEPYRDARMQRLIDDVIQRGHFDLLQVEDDVMSVYNYPSKLPKLLCDSEVQPLLPEQLPSDTLVARLPRSVQLVELARWRRFLQGAWKGFDCVQVFTCRDADTLTAVAPSLSIKARVNPFGIDVPEIYQGEPECPDSLVFVGQFRQAPNVDAALWLAREIFPLIRRSNPNARLIIVGSNPPATVRLLASEVITVTGKVPRVEPYLLRATAVMAPLRTGAGMRVKVLQAMALGKAVIASPLAAEGIDVNGHLPPLILARTNEEMALSALELLASEPARRELGGRARAYVAAHHTWDAHSARLDEIYAELTSGSRDRVTGGVGIGPGEPNR